MRGTFLPRPFAALLAAAVAVPVLACPAPETAEEGAEVEAAAETEQAETAAETARAGAAGVRASRLEGTWRLVSRETADGTVVRPPDVMGAITYAGGIRNFNVFWKGPEGNDFSYSVVSEYRLSETEYTETVLFSVMNDEISGAGLAYELSRPSETVPVTAEDGAMSFDLPFDPVTVTVEGDRLTARAEDGSFVDRWERVR